MDSAYGNTPQGKQLLLALVAGGSNHPEHVDHTWSDRERWRNKDHGSGHGRHGDRGRCRTCRRARPRSLRGRCAGVHAGRPCGRGIISPLWCDLRPGGPPPVCLCHLDGVAPRRPPFHRRARRRRQVRRCRARSR